MTMRSTASLSSLLLLSLLCPSTALAALSSSSSNSRSNGDIRSSARSDSGQRPSPRCGKSSTDTTKSLVPNSRTNFTLPTSPDDDGNGGRPYMLWVPPSYDATGNTPTPLIVSMHGAGRTAWWQSELDRLSDAGAEYGFNTDHAVVYVQSTGSTEDDRFWEGYPGLSSATDDVAYVLAVLDEVAGDRLCVDLARVYASGKSQGGGFSGQVLACDPRSASRFAAFAAVSGAYYVPPDVVGDDVCADPATVALRPCEPQRDRIPLLAFHGGNDTTIFYDGGERRGYCLPAVQHWVAGWVGRDGLDAEPAEVRNLSSQATVSVYAKGDDDRGLVTFIYDGDHVNHDWPATFPNSDNIEHGSGPASFNASSIIMDFFRNYTLP
ncbi:hypothetical protein SLS62_002846 [Diatrype stigma]|uniref:feruloyl esterase n=1 Tax=Diatrype stigma TaxID=117547 RepID=A0AAN9UXI1_9PEZI